MKLLPSSLGLAWFQLSHNKTKLLVASSGVVVAVMLMLVQLGIRRGAIDSSIAIAKNITADIVLLSPRTESIFQPHSLPRSILYRARAHPEVLQVQPLYLGTATFRNPWSFKSYPMSVYGINPNQPMIDIKGLPNLNTRLNQPDYLAFDMQSRPIYGPVTDRIQNHGLLETEVNDRTVRLIGTVSVGVSLNSDGSLYTSPANFKRLFPERHLGVVDIGLIQTNGFRPAELVARELNVFLGPEAYAISQQELVTFEERFLRDTAPLDFIFGMGIIIGFFIGFVVVYQILYSEIANHMPHYATLKAVGFKHFFLIKVVLFQSLIFSIMGYIPGFIIATGIYSLATEAIQMPILMTFDRAFGVFSITLVMCGLSGLVAIQRLKSTQPAEVF